MKLRMKLSDLVDMLTPGPMAKKLRISTFYGIDDRQLKKLRHAMQRGKWKLV